MSITVHRRLSRLERQARINVVPPGQRDPDMVTLCRRLCGDAFRIEMVPVGVSLDDVLARVISKGSALKPVVLPYG